MAEVTEKLTQSAPEGFELISAPARMRKESITLDATGTFQARGEVQTVEGAATSNSARRCRRGGSFSTSCLREVVAVHRVLPLEPGGTALTSAAV